MKARKTNHAVNRKNASRPSAPKGQSHAVHADTGCAAAPGCGGCQYSALPYEKQLSEKQEKMSRLLGEFGEPEPILGMQDPTHYRCKVHHVFGLDPKGHVLQGCYAPGSHRVVEGPDCCIEDSASQAIIRSIRDLVPSFKIRIYDEDSGRGLLRHVMVRRGFATEEILVVLVLASPILPGKNNFVKALLKLHPEITSIVINVNDRDTSMVLGKTDKVIYGPGFIRDELLECRFRISPQSFYQVNPAQAGVLYDTALEFAGVREGRKGLRIIDAYCGTGTIGLCAAKASPGSEVIGIELNPDAVRDARENARDNAIRNARFMAGDAGAYLERLAEDGEKADVLFMDPPRSGSSRAFLEAAARMRPDRIVYISCGPESLRRDLLWLTAHGYAVRRMRPVDMFPMTKEHVETVVLLTPFAG